MQRKIKSNWTVLLLLFLMASASVYAQQRRINGTIVDAATGETIIGANVQVKGSTTGATTDIDGKFTLNITPDSKTLVVSYIGYVTQELPIDRSSFDIFLKENMTELDELVVVGYGVQKKSDLTGSIGSVSSERITAIGSSSVMSALQGATPGVDIQTNSTRPGAGYTIKVRGQNSISGGNPLYVVDGIVMNDIDFLNPSDIEKVDILKDASSTAIYGSRGSNGVVIVQTKGASSAKSNLNVSYDGFWGQRVIARVPDFMDGREWIDYRTSMYYTWNATSGKYDLTDANKSAITQNSKLVHNALYNEDYTDWLSLGTQNGTQQNHFININGSSKDISYNLGAGYQKDEGNFLLEKMDRYTLKGSINHKANKYFESGANFSFNHQTVNSGSQYGYRDLLRIPNILKAYRENGELIEQPGIKAEIDGDGNFTSSTNPLLEIKSGSNESRQFNVLGSLFASITPVSGLNIKSTISPMLRQQRMGYYRGVVAGNRTINQAQTDHRQTFEWTWDNVINFNRSFAEKHNVNVTLVQSMYKTQYERLALYAENFPYDSKWYNILKGDIKPGSNESNSSYSQTTLLSYAARANYDYAGKYLITGTVRYDGSSKLANKWSAFPSAAIAWRLTEEDFLKGSSVLSNLKMRLSFGYSGNNNGVSAYGTTTSPNTSSSVYYDFNGSTVSGYATGAPVNAALTWEKTREWNLGVDFGFFNGRINGSVDLYDKLSDGLLMRRTLTIESGVESMNDNIGSVNNRGIEVSLNTLNIRTKDISWTTTFNFAYNKNSIESLYGRKEDVVGEARFIGQPINVIYDYNVNGVYGSEEWKAMSAEQRTAMGARQPGFARAIDTNGDGRITTDDRIILGQVDPKWTGSFSSNLSFKGFDFSFNIYTRQGVFINDRFLQEFGLASTNQRGRPKLSADYYIPANAARFDWSKPFTVDANGQHWAPWNDNNSVENVNAKYPLAGMAGDFYGSNGSYQEASFIKVRNITLGYTIPKKIVKSALLQNVRIYANVLNPFTFTKYQGWDPEYATTNLADGNGPSTITYQIGVNLKF